MSEPRDSELQAYLEGRSQLSRAYRELEKLEPPAHLDEQVLRQARHAPARPGRSTRSVKGWSLALGAIVASTIVAVILVPQLSNAPHQDPMHEETAIRSRAPTGERPAVLSPPDAAQKRLEETLERHLKVGPQPGAMPAQADGHRGSEDSRDPEDWLAEIAALEQAGQAEAARQALQAFRQQYPDYVIPSTTQPR